MEYKPLSKYVKLSQGLAINKQTEHLVSNKKNEQFIYPLLRIADMMNKKYNKYISKDVNNSVIANKKSIIYTRTGQIGLVFRGFAGVVHNNSFIVDLTSDEITEDYLYAILQTDFVRSQALKFAKNSVQPDLTHEMFKSIVIPVPDKRTQEKISKFILNIKDKINNLNKYNTTLYYSSMNIFKYMFRNNNYPKNIKTILNQEVKGFLPSSWKIENYKDNSLYTIVSPGIEYFDKKIYLATADVNGTEITGGKEITYDNRETRANMQPSENTIWFAKMKNSIKHLFFGNYSSKDIDAYILSTGFLGIKAKKDFYFEYLISIIHEPVFEIIKDKFSHGATQEAINNSDLKYISLIVPDDQSLLEYHNITKDLFKQIYYNSKEIELLLKAINYFLPLLMNGQSKIGD